MSLSNEIIDLMVQIAHNQNIEPLKMVSGAGHDCAALADLTKTGMIFVPSEKGRSHCPEESTRPEDIGLGCDLLLATAITLAKPS